MDDNIHNLRDALEWLDRSIREEAEYDGEMTNAHATQLGFITNMLDKFPLRQCDVGTADEQSERMEKSVCSKHYGCVRCSLRKTKYSDCSLLWAQTPYEAQEGAGE